MRVRLLLQGSAVIAASLGVVQALAYFLSVTAAKSLDIEDFGAFGALLNLVLIGSVVALGLQAVAARSVVRAARPSGYGPAAIGARLLRFGLIAGIALGVLGIACAPIVSGWLGLPSVWPFVWAVLSLPPLTLAGAQYGIAQGHQRYALLAILLVANGVLRYLGGMAGLLASDSVAATYAAMAIGSWCGAALGWLLVRRLASGHPSEYPGLANEVIHATHALLAFYVASSIDVILARIFLTPVESGEYAAGSLVTKVALWLPYFIAIVAFPKMAGKGGRRATTWAAAAVALIGVVVVGVLASFPGLILDLVAGNQYSAIVGFLWIFGFIGSAFAMAQLLLYSRIAVNDRRAVFVLWTAVVLIIGGVGLFHQSVFQVASVVATVALCLCVVGMAGIPLQERPLNGARIESTS